MSIYKSIQSTIWHFQGISLCGKIQGCDYNLLEITLFSNLLYLIINRLSIKYDYLCSWLYYFLAKTKIVQTECNGQRKAEGFCLALLRCSLSYPKMTKWVDTTLEVSAQFIFFAKVLPDSNSSQYGLWDSLWEGLARRPLGKANNKPTDNRLFCWKSVGLFVSLSILIRWIKDYISVIG